jgi:CheY-like chemotaxis protein
MHSSSDGRIHLDGIQVLSVDDDADTLYLIRELLEDAGAIVTSTGSAQEGLEVLARERPEVLLSDIIMPGARWVLADRPGACAVASARGQDRSGGPNVAEQRGGSRAHSSRWVSKSHREAN